MKLKLLSQSGQLRVGVDFKSHSTVASHYGLNWLYAIKRLYNNNIFPMMFDKNIVQARIYELK